MFRSIPVPRTFAFDKCGSGYQVSSNIGYTLNNKSPQSLSHVLDYKTLNLFNNKVTTLLSKSPITLLTKPNLRLVFVPNPISKVTINPQYDLGIAYYYNFSMLIKSKQEEMLEIRNAFSGMWLPYHQGGLRFSLPLHRKSNDDWKLPGVA
jgi:hypothetical protein